MQVEHEEQVMGLKKMSESSNITSESSNDTGTSNSSSTVTMNGNGEKHDVVEEENVTKFETLAEIQGEDVEPSNNAASNQGSNGHSVYQNGSSVAHSHAKTNGGEKEIDSGSNGSSFSKSPATDVGLKFVESLFDASSSDVSSKPSEIYNAERNTVNGGKQLSKEAEPEEEEFDVEGVIQKQETHDLFCPNCRSCITKRVILHRRKRKIGEISKGDEASGSGVDQHGSTAASGIITEQTQQPSLVGETSGACFDAISCFSCFSLFIPSGEGFLCWRFKPKQDVTQQLGGTITSPEQVIAPVSEESKPEGNFFPLWMVTCCQPTDKQNPDTEAQPQQTDPSWSPSDDIPQSSEPNVLSEQNTDTPVPHISNLGTSQNKPLKPIEPEHGTPSSETPVLAVDEGKFFPMWILTCCQPSMDGTRNVYKEKPAEGILSGHTTPLASSNGKNPTSEPPDGKIVTAPESNPPCNMTDPPTAPSDEIPESPGPETPAIPIRGPPISLPKPVSPVHPDGAWTSSAQPSVTPDGGDMIVEMPEELLKLQSNPVMPFFEHGEGSLPDIKKPLLEPLDKCPRRGVSGVDIIKAIVYGGLLESITSLSVITSAAGGDATTLNIVALGLANVIGGLVVLVHNLRALKNEHITEHYEAQLGRPGHYLIHAIVAIISYLIFGLMSPIIYGFSFRKSEHKDYKLATLAAASLLCITVLSTAKAYVRNPPKAYIKTVFYYISLGFMVSGLGYVAGDLINMGLKKLGVFDSKAPVNGAWLSF